MSIITKLSSGSLSFYGLHWSVSDYQSLPKLSDVYTTIVLSDSVYGNAPAYTTLWLGEAVSKITVGTETYKFIGTYLRSNGLPVDAYYSGKNWMVSMELEGAHKRLVFCLNGDKLDHWIFLTSPDGSKLQMFNACNLIEGDMVQDESKLDLFYSQEIYSSIAVYTPDPTGPHYSPGTITCAYGDWIDATNYESLYVTSNPNLLADASTFRAYLKEAASVIPPSYLVSVAHHATAAARSEVSMVSQRAASNDIASYGHPVYTWKGVKDRSLSGGIYEAIKGSYTSCALSPESDGVNSPLSLKRALGIPYIKGSTAAIPYVFKTPYGASFINTPTGKTAVSLSDYADSTFPLLQSDSDYAKDYVVAGTVTIGSTYSGSFTQNIYCTDLSLSRFKVGSVFTLILSGSDSEIKPLPTYSADYVVAKVVKVSGDSDNSELVIDVMDSSYSDGIGTNPLSQISGMTFNNCVFLFFGAWGASSATIGAHSSAFSEDSISLGLTRPQFGTLFQLGCRKDGNYARYKGSTLGLGFNSPDSVDKFDRQDCIVVSGVNQALLGGPSASSPSTAGRVFVKGIGGYTGVNDWRECYSVQDVDFIRRYCGDYVEDFLNQKFCVTFTVRPQTTGSTSETVSLQYLCTVTQSNPVGIFDRVVRKITMQKGTSSETEVSLKFNESVPVGTVFRAYMDFTTLMNVPTFGYTEATRFLKIRSNSSPFNFPGDVEFPHLLLLATSVDYLFSTTSTGSFLKSVGINRALNTSISFGHLIAPNAITAKHVFYESCSVSFGTKYAVNSFTFRGDIVLPNATDLTGMFANFAVESFFVTKNSGTGTVLSTNLDLAFPKVIAPNATVANSFFSCAFYHRNGQFTSSSVTLLDEITRIRSIKFPELISAPLQTHYSFIVHALCYKQVSSTATITSRGSIEELTIPRYRYATQGEWRDSVGCLFGYGYQSVTTEVNPTYDFSSLPPIKINVPFVGDSPYTWYTEKASSSKGISSCLKYWMHQHFVIHTDTPFETTNSIFHLDPTTYTGYWQPLSVTYVNTNELPDDDPTKVVDVSSLFDTTPTYPSGYSDLNLRHHPKVLYKNGYTYNVQQKANPSGVATDPDQYYYLEWDGTTITAHANL